MSSEGNVWTISTEIEGGLGGGISDCLRVTECIRSNGGGKDVKEEYFTVTSGSVKKGGAAAKYKAWNGKIAGIGDALNHPCVDEVALVRMAKVCLTAHKGDVTAVLATVTGIINYGAPNPMLLRSAMVRLLPRTTASVLVRVLNKVLRKCAMASAGNADSKRGIRASVLWITALIDTTGSTLQPTLITKIKQTVKDVISQGEALRVVGTRESGWGSEKHSRSGYCIERLVL
jgi:hypothetical protein